MSWGRGRERVIASLQPLHGWALEAVGASPWSPWDEGTMPTTPGKAGGQQKLALCLHSLVFPSNPTSPFFSFIMTEASVAH